MSVPGEQRVSATTAPLTTLNKQSHACWRANRCFGTERASQEDGTEVCSCFVSSSVEAVGASAPYASWKGQNQTNRLCATVVQYGARAVAW
jgi:hypothetical protein